MRGVAFGREDVDRDHSDNIHQRWRAPVELGLVASFYRPGGNATGFASFSATIGTKRLGLLRELVPTAALITALLKPEQPDFQSRARALRDPLHVLRLRYLGRPADLSRRKVEPSAMKVARSRCPCRSRVPGGRLVETSLTVHRLELGGHLAGVAGVDTIDPPPGGQEDWRIGRAGPR